MIITANEAALHGGGRFIVYLAFQSRWSEGDQDGPNVDARRACGRRDPARSRMHDLDASGKVKGVVERAVPPRERRCRVTSPLDISIGAVPQ